MGFEPVLTWHRLIEEKKNVLMDDKSLSIHVF